MGLFAFSLSFAAPSAIRWARHRTTRREPAKLGLVPGFRTTPAAVQPRTSSSMPPRRCWSGKSVRGLKCATAYRDFVSPLSNGCSHRDQRLELQTLAGNLLSQGSSPEIVAPVYRCALRYGRDQYVLLSHTEDGERCAMAVRHAAPVSVRSQTMAWNYPLQKADELAGVSPPLLRSI
jgi:hypothetical protein